METDLCEGDFMDTREPDTLGNPGFLDPSFGDASMDAFQNGNPIEYLDNWRQPISRPEKSNNDSQDGPSLT